MDIKQCTYTITKYICKQLFENIEQNTFRMNQAQWSSIVDKLLKKLKHINKVRGKM